MPVRPLIADSTHRDRGQGNAFRFYGVTGIPRFPRHFWCLWFIPLSFTLLHMTMNLTHYFRILVSSIGVRHSRFEDDLMIDDLMVGGQFEPSAYREVNKWKKVVDFSDTSLSEPIYPAVRAGKNCFAINRIHDSLSEPLPNIKGKWVVNHSLPAPYWDVSCPFIIKNFNCATYRGKFAHYAERTRALKFVPDASGVRCHLETFDGDRFLRKLLGRHLEFIGDSITQQHFVSTTCRLLLWVDWAATNRFWEQYHADIAAPSCSSRKGRLTNAQPANSNNKPDATNWRCYSRYKKVIEGNELRTNHTTCVFFRTGTRICYRGALTSRTAMHYLSRRWGPEVIVVANAGAHIALNEYRSRLSDIAKALNLRPFERRPLVFYREYVAQHKTLDGSQCEASLLGDTHESKRASIEREVLLAESIPMLHTYESSLPLGKAHTRDCQHWCQPGLPDFWSLLTYNAFIHRL